MRKIVHTNHRIEVHVTTLNLAKPGPAGHDDMKLRLDIVAREIRRHVDGIERVTMHWETAAECSLCGRPWEVLSAEDVEQPGDAPGLPVCCEAAQAEWRAEQAGDPS